MNTLNVLFLSKPKINRCLSALICKYSNKTREDLSTFYKINYGYKGNYER